MSSEWTDEVQARFINDEEEFAPRFLRQRPNLVVQWLSEAMVAVDSTCKGWPRIGEGYEVDVYAAGDGNLTWDEVEWLHSALGELLAAREAGR